MVYNRIGGICITFMIECNGTCVCTSMPGGFVPQWLPMCLQESETFCFSLVITFRMDDNHIVIIV